VRYSQPATRPFGWLRRRRPQVAESADGMWTRRHRSRFRRERLHPDASRSSVFYLTSHQDPEQ